MNVFEQFVAYVKSTGAAHPSYTRGLHVRDVHYAEVPKPAWLDRQVPEPVETLAERMARTWPDSDLGWPDKKP